jgi:hypothetical protein
MANAEDPLVVVVPAPQKAQRTRTTDNTAPGPLNTAVKLTMGMLFYRAHDEKRTPHHCLFQFNPTELERSRNIAFTRSPTGNVLEEPRVGGRNAAKRKQTRKPEAWDMSITLRFDAGYGMVAWAEQSQLRETARTGALPKDITKGDTAANPLTATFKDEILRIQQTIDFFEGIADAQPWVSENEKVANADETPPPPYVMLAFGNRVWECAVKSVRIKEEDYTPDLYPRRFEATLSLEIIQTVAQNDQGKGTAR